jgi:hypothetical protein
MLTATVSIGHASNGTVINGGPYDGWRIIGTAERLACPPPRYGEGSLMAYRSCALEVRKEGEKDGIASRPLAAGDIKQWTDPFPEGHPPDTLTGPRPLLAIDHPMASSGDAASGPGLPIQVLAPTSSLTEALGLRPGEPMVLNDDAGPGLALITWRACYQQSDYHLAWPRLTGCAVVLRPDLLSRLAGRLKASLVIREFVAADEALAEPDH